MAPNSKAQDKAELSTPRKGAKRAAKTSTPDSPAIGSGHSRSGKKRKVSRPRSSPSKNDDDNPTWAGDQRIATKSTAKTHDETWMAGYLGLPSKYQLRCLAMSPFILPYAVEQKICSFTQTEIASAVTQLAELSKVPADDNDSSDDDNPKPLEPFEDCFSLATLSEEYIDAHEGADTDRKQIPTDKRTELLARMLLTVDKALDLIESCDDVDEYQKRTSEIMEATNRAIRGREKMPYFYMPLVEWDYLVEPVIGPLDFDGKKESAVEKWLRLLYLLRYAAGRIAKSKWTMAGCMGALLGASDTERNKRSPEAARTLIETQARKWLGYDEDWANAPDLDVTAIPTWMRPKNVSEDDSDSRDRPKQDAGPNPRRKIVFEAIWLKELDDKMSDRCSSHWDDFALRSELHVSEDVSEPDFAARRKRIRIDDPRGFSDYPHFRDNLRVKLGFPLWKIDFSEAYWLNKRVSSEDIDNDLLEQGLEEQPEVEGKPRCVRIHFDSGDEPYLTYDEFRKEIENGADVQTVGFICRPLNKRHMRHFPWETTAYLPLDQNALKDFASKHRQLEQLSTEAEKPSETQHAVVEGASTGDHEHSSTTAEKPREPEQPACDGPQESTGVEVEMERELAKEIAEKALRSSAKMLLRAFPKSKKAIEYAEKMGRKIARTENTTDRHLDIFDFFEFASDEERLQYFDNIDVSEPKGQLKWSRQIITGVLSSLKFSQRCDIWGNEDWLQEVPDLAMTRKHIDDARFLADAEREKEADFQNEGNTIASQDVSGSRDAMDNDDEEEPTLSVSQAAMTMSISSQACLGPPLAVCCVALGFTDSGEKHKGTALSLYESPYFPTASGRKFLPHQVTGIAFLIVKLIGRIPDLEVRDYGDQVSTSKWLSDNYSQTKCAVLADNMGLSKTFQSISVIHFIMRYGPHSKKGCQDYRPTLILVPSCEILKLWDKELYEHYPHIRRFVAANINKDSLSKDTVVISRKECTEHWDPRRRFVWDSSKIKAEKTVILATLETYAIRTMRSECKGDDNKDIVWHSKWADQDRKFRTVWIDEAHKIRHTHTKSYQAVSHTISEGIVPITATPSFNVHENIIALYNVMWDAYSAFMKKHHAEDFEWCTRNVKSAKAVWKLDDLPANDSKRAFAMKPQIIASLVRRGDLTQLHRIMPKIECLVMIRRSAQSVIPLGIQDGLVALRGLLPEVVARTASISQDTVGMAHSQAIHFQLSMEYNEVMQNFMKSGGMEKAMSDAKARPNLTDNTRRFLLVSAGVNLYRLDDILTHSRSPLLDLGSKGSLDGLSPTLTKMRHAGINAFDLADILWQEGDPVWYDRLDSASNMLYILARGCPALQLILKVVRDQLLPSLAEGQSEGRVRKILITEEVPLTAFYYERVLQAVGVKARVYHSALSAKEREDLKESFRSTEANTVTVLILMYRVGGVGLNLDGACYTAIIASPSESHMKEEQAAYRVIRITNVHDRIEILRVKARNSYHEYKESRQIDRLIPDLASRQFPLGHLAVMLNALQAAEIDAAHSSEEGKNLKDSEDLLLESYSRQRVLDAVRRLRNTDKASDEQARNPDKKQHDPDKVEILSAYKRISAGDKGWKSANFLEQMTRQAYYKDYRELDSKIKTLFSHSKNRIRRNLSFEPGKIYTEKDVEVAIYQGNEPLVQRAFENLLKLKTGTRNTQHKPGPHIDFDMLPEGFDWAVCSDLPNFEGQDDLRSETSDSEDEAEEISSSEGPEESGNEVDMDIEVGSEVSEEE